MTISDCTIEQKLGMDVFVLVWEAKALVDNDIQVAFDIPCCFDETRWLHQIASLSQRKRIPEALLPCGLSRSTIAPYPLFRSLNASRWSIGDFRLKWIQQVTLIIHREPVQQVRLCKTAVCAGLRAFSNLTGLNITPHQNVTGAIWGGSITSNPPRWHVFEAKHFPRMSMRAISAIVEVVNASPVSWKELIVAINARAPIPCEWIVRIICVVDTVIDTEVHGPLLEHWTQNGIHFRA
ncbi:hypothetical protein D3C71_826500 [compost metagenome]